MRFLETRIAKETGTLRLTKTRGNGQLPTTYAILSHTWEEDEITLEDIENGKANDESVKSLAALASLSKLRGACIQAAADGYEYIWIDSCCIEKRDPAELSEAINSMFVWYRDAAICYAFLRDAPNELLTTQAKAEFTHHKWFTRGWTLQELLAPAEVIFFSGDWLKIGDKRLLCLLLANSTGIDKDILLGERPLTSASVARRMSWAAKRETTRPEDGAYCMMGIFSVNMPMLYGEGGEKAFLRLQEEIMKVSDDQSLFAWVDLASPLDAIKGLLAPEPSYFLHSNTIVPYQDWEPRAPYASTNRGLKIDLHLTELADGEYVAALDCPVPPDYEDSTFLAIYLRKLSDSDEQYARVRVGQFASVRRRGYLRTIYIRQKPQAPSPEGAYLHHHVQLRTGPPPDIYQVVSILLPGRMALPAALPSRDSAREWVPAKWPTVFPMLRKPMQLSGAIIFQNKGHERLALMIGTLGGFDIAFSVLELDAELDVAQLSFKAIQGQFEPSTAGRFEHPYHSVRVSATPVLQTSSKYYMVDIGIEAVNLSVRDIAKQAYDIATGSGYDYHRSQDHSVLLEDKKHADKTKRKLAKKLSIWKRLLE
ncbi:HET-domain-containing protein [Hypoxylon sp. FL0890]|nr:HET-domain-containing protein [Hypoxylon sp. FL0890]